MYEGARTRVNSACKEMEDFNVIFYAVMNKKNRTEDKCSGNDNIKMDMWSD